MRQRFLSIFLLGVFLLGSSFLLADQKVLTILHTSDTHSALFPFGPLDKYGGIARMSTLVKQLRMRNENVLAFHSGDVFVGSFEFNKYLGYPELKFMENLYDGMELGNHEFDLGLEGLAGVLSGAIPGKDPVALPIVCANIDQDKIAADFPALAPVFSAMVQPYIPMTVGDITVGITGVVNTEQQNYSPQVFSILKDPYTAAGEQAATLKALGCDIVICLSHLGTTADIMGLSQVPNIDIILGGHAHDILDQPMEIIRGDGSKVYLVEGGEYGLFLGELKVQVNGSGVSLQGYKPHSINWRIRKDPRLLMPLARLRVGIVRDPRFGPVYTRHIASARWDIGNAWDPDSQYRDTALGNLVTDAIRAGVTKADYTADAAIEAMGYIAHKIYKGKVVGNDVMRVVPYGYDQATGLGFKIVLVKLTGEQLYKGLEYSVAYLPYSRDFSIQASGLTFSYYSGVPPPGRVDFGSIRINDLPITLGGEYWIALNEQVYAVLKSLDPTIPDPVETGLFEYNLVRDYMKGLNHIAYETEGRILDLSVP